MQPTLMGVSRRGVAGSRVEIHHMVRSEVRPDMRLARLFSLRDGYLLILCVARQFRREEHEVEIHLLVSPLSSTDPCEACTKGLKRIRV